MKVYSHPRCSTCKKALKFLESNDIEFKQIDITTHPPSKAELESMLERSGGDVRKLFNTSGMQYRDLGLKEKLETMSTPKALELLSKNGMLVRRPFVIDRGVGLVGFRPEIWKKTFR